MFSTTAVKLMTTMPEFEFHPLANLFPSLPDDEFERLVEDVKINGLQVDIFLAEGLIADGRHRYRACRQTGVEPRFREWDGRGDLLSILFSLNDRRRHMTAGQRSMIAAEAANMTRGRNPSGEGFVSQTQAARAVNVSVASVERAVSILKHGAEELIEEVKAGKLDIAPAGRIARLPKEQQRKIIKTGRRDQKAILRKLKITSLRNTARGYGGCLHCNAEAEWSDDTVSAFAQRLEQRSKEARRAGRAHKDFAAYFETISFEIEDERRADTVRPYQEKILRHLDTYDCVEKTNLQRLTDIPIKEFNDVIATMLDLNMIEAVQQGGKTDVARGARKTLYKRKERIEGELTYELDPDDDDQEDIYLDNRYDW